MESAVRISGLFPTQYDNDHVQLGAKRLVAQNLNVRIPVDLAPPRGRPVKKADTIKRYWYEKGPHPGNTTIIFLLTLPQERPCRYTLRLASKF